MKNFIEIAAEAAQELEEEYAGKPEMEFIAWLNIALEREAMVSEAYGDSYVEGQLAEWAAEFDINESVIKVIRLALAAVWAQENAHQSYFRAMLEGINPSQTLVDRIGNKLKEIRGRVEGRVIAGLMSPKLLKRTYAQVAIAIGKSTSNVPAYVKSLHQTTFSEYCYVNADLEHTAVLGYDRMLELGRSMQDWEIVTDTPVLIDLGRTGNDERYHEELYRKLAGWPPPPPPAGTGPVLSPMGPAHVPSDKMTVADAREIIARAKTHAYGGAAAHLYDGTVAINENLIFNDPLTQHLKRFALKEVEGEASSYMTAGAS